MNLLKQIFRHGLRCFSQLVNIGAVYFKYVTGLCALKVWASVNIVAYVSKHLYETRNKFIVGRKE